MSVDVPVANPELVARLIRARSIPEGETDARVTMRMLRDARYLLATQLGHPDGGPPVVDGMMRAGSRIDVFQVALPDGRPALAVFTDWPSLRAALGDGEQWSGLIEPGEDVFRLGLRPEYPGGAVINPAGPEVTLALEPERIASLYASTRRRGGSSTANA